MPPWSERDWSVHPGELLQEVLDDRHETAAQLALAAELPQRYIEALLAGDAPVHGTAAAHLMGHTGVPEAFWLGVQTGYTMRAVTITGTMRVLVTGSRAWRRRRPIEYGLRQVIGERRDVLIVHGAAFGADGVAQAYADLHGFGTDPHRASRFPSPQVRNEHMVGLGADVCLAFALSWDSGTGHCARAARRAGIPVIDYGVDTRRDAPDKVLARR